MKMLVNMKVPKVVNVTRIEVHAKVTDSGQYRLLDEEGNVLKDVQDYVPSFFPGDHYGDYLILNIDLATGWILNWKKPSSADLEEYINGDQ